MEHVPPRLSISCRGATFLIFPVALLRTNTPIADLGYMPLTKAMLDIYNDVIGSPVPRAPGLSSLCGRLLMIFRCLSVPAVHSGFGLWRHPANPDFIKPGEPGRLSKKCKGQGVLSIRDSHWRRFSRSKHRDLKQQDRGNYISTKTFCKLVGQKHFF